MTDAENGTAPDSVVIAFHEPERDGPVAVVIGPGHAPYYLFSDGRREPASPFFAEK